MTRFTRSVKAEESGICCGEPMMVVNNKLTCMQCNKLEKYVEGVFEEPKSQQTQYDLSGNIIYGKSHEKSDEQKVVMISNEFTAKILQHRVNQESARLMRRVSLLMYKIVKDGNGKKKDNRDQLFAACMYILVIQDKYVYSIKEIASMLGLQKMGIGNGMGHIIKYILSKITDTVDLNSILSIDDQTLSINISPLYCVTTKYLTSLKLDTDIVLDTHENITFCTDLVEFMTDNSIAYDTNCETKCAGAVYYLISRLGLAKNAKKSAIARMMGIYQAIMMGPFNTLMTPACQEMLELQYRYSGIMH
jgi:hypothetical protein